MALVLAAKKVVKIVAYGKARQARDSEPYVGVGQPVIERLLPANELVLLDCLDDQQHQR
jgi:hypothetical protein